MGSVPGSAQALQGWVRLCKQPLGECSSEVIFRGVFTRLWVNWASRPVFKSVLCAWLLDLGAFSHVSDYLRKTRVVSQSNDKSPKLPFWGQGMRARPLTAGI